MYIAKRFKKYDIMLSFFFCLAICGGILIFPLQASVGARDAVFACGTVLIPSLFPFMVISKIFILSGAYAKISKPFSKITMFLFKLPANTGGVILLSLVGGYPVGATMINDLQKQNGINDEQAERMVYFCVGGGPAFIMGTVGAILLRSASVGIFIFLSQLVSAVIIGIILGFVSKNNASLQYSKKESIRMNFSSSITSACRDASSSMLLMCSLVIFFGTVLALIKKVFEGLPNIFTLISVITEVTAGCRFSSSAGMPTEIIAFAIGWGGLCVHFQVFSALKNVKINKAFFVFLRFIQGILTSLFTYILFKLVPVELQTTVIFGNNVATTQAGTVFGAIALIIMCGIFLVSSKQNKYT